MLNNLIKFLRPDYKNLKNRNVFLWLFMLALFIRFPFFFRDYIDRDESTFILLAQSWVNGYLPYTQLWDLKPPLTFAFFAAIISVFGKNLFVIRLFGVLLVSITALFSYSIGKKISSRKTAFWSAWVCVLLLSMFGSLQGVMSEHICIASFMIGLYFTIDPKKAYYYLLGGLFMGISLMVKLNMAYPILFAGLCLLYFEVGRLKSFKGLLNTINFGFGVIAVILITVLPYYLDDITSVWWESVVLASLEYTQVKRYSIFKLAPIVIIITTFLLFSFKKQLLNFKDKKIIFLCIMVISVVLSFVRGGRVNGHYLIQLHPILIVLIGVVISRLKIKSTFRYQPILFILIIIIPVEAYLEYFTITKHKIEKGSFYNGEGISVPTYIVTNQLETKNILFLEYHIGYWFLNTQPPTTAATHPTNITREALFPFFHNPRKNAIAELRYILEELQPKTIVGRSNHTIFDPSFVDENTYINIYLEKHYSIITTIERAIIYQRIE